jgi:TDG/mug DNA glycosylase family protein
MVLPDLLRDNLNFVFCGTAAGDKSAERKAYYAGRGNLFYMVLASCGFTPKFLKPEEYPLLLTYNIGLTDLAKNTHGMDINLTKDDFDTISFEEKILKHQPKYICFNGKEAARVYMGLNNTKQVFLGLQNQKIGNTQLYVAPSTSFSARKYWDEKYWQELNNLL